MRSKHDGSNGKSTGRSKSDELEVQPKLPSAPEITNSKIEKVDYFDNFVLKRCKDPPPCLTKIPCFWALCENGYCCPAIGRCRLRSMGKDRLRKRIMYIAALLSFISIFLGVWASFATSMEKEMVRAAPWSVGRVPLKVFLGSNNSTTYRIVQAKMGDAFKADALVSLYIGLNGIVVDTTSALRGFDGEEVKFINWDEAQCTSTIQMRACEACKTQATGSSTMAIMGVITTVPQLTTDLLRAFAENDLYCQKAFGIVTGLFGMITYVFKNT